MRDVDDNALPVQEAARQVSEIYELPQELLHSVIDKRENRAWDPEAVSEAGAVGLAQIKPIAVCTRIPDCNRLASRVRSLRDRLRRNDTEYDRMRAVLMAEEIRLKRRLGQIEERLKSPPLSFNLCWGGRILFDNLRICGGDPACALAGYLNGEFTSRYIAEILGP